MPAFDLYHLVLAAAAAFAWFRQAKASPHPLIDGLRALLAQATPENVDVLAHAVRALLDKYAPPK